MCGPPATGGHPAASPGWRTLRSAPNCSLPASDLSHLSPSLLTKSGGPSEPSPPAAGFRGAASGTPEGRQANGKRAEVHTPPPPQPHIAGCPAVVPQPADAPGPAVGSPAAPAPPPILPAPQRPPTQAREWEGAAWAAGATGVGAALLTLPGSRRLGRVPLTFGKASPGPAPRAREEAATGSREPGAAKAPSAQQRGGEPSSHLLAGEV